MPPSQEHANHSNHEQVSNAAKSWLPLILQIMVIVFGLGMFKAQIDGRFTLVDQQFTIQRALIDNDLLQLENKVNSFDGQLKQHVDVVLTNRQEIQRHAASIQENALRLANSRQRQQLP